MRRGVRAVLDLVLHGEPTRMVLAVVTCTWGLLLLQGQASVLLVVDDGVVRLNDHAGIGVAVLALGLLLLVDLFEVLPRRLRRLLLFVATISWTYLASIALAAGVGSVGSWSIFAVAWVGFFAWVRS